MKNRFGNRTEANVEKHPGVQCAVTAKSNWEWEHYRDGKLIDQWTDTNLITNEGLDEILDVMFSSATQITSWYVAIFEDDYTPIAGNTYATPGYTESSAYSEGTRPAWSEGGVSSQSITNSASKATFTINATKTIYGASLVGGGTAASTKGDTAGGGTLYASSKFGVAKAVESSDVLKVTITINSSDV